MQRKMFQTPTEPLDMRFYENRAHRRGFRFVCGIDEAGRGPLAGPVVAASVILPKGTRLDGVTDSKRLTAAQREEFFDVINSRALAVGIGVVDNIEIDRINILQATFRAMLLAVEGMPVKPDYILIDGPYKLLTDIRQQGIPGGDALSLTIASASIIAKVHRDRIMRKCHERYPEYGFDRHKGYPTSEHFEAIRRHGPCPLHRISFHGVLPDPEPCADE
ncbi:MAG: ribonuclease HII [Desulfobacteraceae bacterium]|nr:ribonuclease HII [Desulfobacteraceae bacterium]